MKIFRDMFFYLDSNSDLNNINKFFGYVWLDDKFYVNSYDQNRLIDDINYGSFVNIINTEKEIIIQEDFFGSFGLFLFRANGFWALSNSFLFLLQNISGKFNLSLNYDFISANIKSPLVVPGFKETMVNEIERVFPFERVIINKNKKNIEFDNLNRKDNFIDLDSEVAFSLIDAWHIKWNSLINSLTKQNYAVQIDLSGGFDSRAAFSITRKPNVEFNKVTVYNLNDALHTHKDDKVIAQQIASIYNFKLNQFKERASQPITFEESLINSFYPRLPFTKQYYFQTAKFREPMFCFGGQGGEWLRGYCSELSLDEFIDNYKKRNIFASINMEDYYDNFINRQILIAKKHFNNEVNIINHILNYNVNRYHFKNQSITSLFINNITVSPLLDPVLAKLKIYDESNDSKLFFAILYERFLPELHDVNFDSGRILPEEIQTDAHNLNNKYIYSADQNNKSVMIKLNTDFMNTYNEGKITINSRNDIHNRLIEIYKNDTINISLNYLLNNDLYYFAINFCERNKLFPLQYINIFLTLYIVDRYINKFGNYNNCITNEYKDFLPFLLINNKINKSCNMLQHFIDIYNILLLDINFNNLPNIKFYIDDCTRSIYRIEQPRWLNNSKSSGYRIYISSQNSYIIFSCSNDCKINFALFSMDKVNINKNYINPAIEISAIDINIQNSDTLINFLDQPILCSTTFPYRFSLNVKSNVQYILKIRHKASDSNMKNIFSDFVNFYNL